MLTIYSEDHRLQHGKVELTGGHFIPVVEKPERAETILARIKAVGLGEVRAPERFGVDPIARVHAPHFIRFLETAWDEWVAAHGEIDALPTNWAVRNMRQIVPSSIEGKLGYYASDCGTPITAGTWRAALSSVDVALTGAKLVAADGKPVFSLCRPPGHHASTDVYCGYCFFNNAAVAAQWFRDNGAARVAVLDIDYHHGNGTQEIFYSRDDVLFVSLHADPNVEYPYYLGYAEERGAGAGEGFNLNLPMPFGTIWDRYREALDAALARIRDYGADAVVLSFGADTFQEDPISQFKLNSDDFTRMGEILGRGLGVPTLTVMEGGYAVDALGVNVSNLLQALEGAAG
jgi:acetoin utilization deacetylase AcuC-like enzyme